MFRRLVKQLDKYHPHIMLSCSTIGLGLGVFVGIDDNRFVGINNPNKYTLADRMITPVCSGLIGLFIGTFMELINDNKEMIKIIKEQQEQIKCMIPKIGNTINNTTNNNYNDDDDDNDDKNEK